MIRNSSFINNKVNAILCSNPIGLIVDNCLFQNNTTNNSGAAINVNSIKSFATPFPSLKDCIFINNISFEGNGGAIYFKWHNLNITNCLFKDNQCKQRGGALWIQGTHNLTNCVIVNNNAGVGGAIYSSSGGTSYLGQLNNCTFWNNHSDTSGGAYYMKANNFMRSYNTIFWSNYNKDSIQHIISLSPVDMRNCIFQDQSALVSNSFTKTNTLNAYPGFRDTLDLIGPDNKWKTSDDGMALFASSIAINSGDSSLISTAIFSDFVGNRRIVSSNIDIGAFEYVDSLGLPVKLINFNANPDHSYVRLSWTTLYEKNNDHFEIERATDTGLNDWETIAKVAGKGTSLTPVRYKHLDHIDISEQTLYYRLKQVDHDGRYEYSSVIAVYIEPVENASFATIYPNPTCGSFTIRMENRPIQGLAVYNSIGELVYTESIKHNIDTLDLDLQNQAPGIYIVKVQSDKYHQTIRLLLKQ